MARPLVLAAVLLVCALAAWGQARPLYAAQGVSVAAVKQGSIGGCYIFATLAAMAERNPERVTQEIRSLPDGTYTVIFPDGDREHVYRRDLRYARAEGFDRSAGAWVGVLFRAYAQRVVREALLRGVKNMDAPLLVSAYLQNQIQSADELMEVYDRAIRSAVRQDGSIDRKELEANLRSEGESAHLPPALVESVNGLLQKHGVFDDVARVIQENGEAFGAYRAVGLGGQLLQPMEAFYGGARSWDIGSRAQAARILNRLAGHPVAATAATWSKDEVPAAVRRQIAGWWIASHAYTVLGYDPARRMVRIRNPWGEFPGDNGIAEISLDDFVKGFAQLVLAPAAESGRAARGSVAGRGN